MRHLISIMLASIGLFAISVTLAEEPKPKVEQPAIVSAKEWGSSPQLIAPERKQVPKFVTIHHAGVLWKPGDDPAKKILALQAYGQREKNWPDLPYHYLIAPDGRIFEGRPVQYEPDTNTKYKTTGHIGIELWGDFEKQRPSEAQVTSLVKLTAWLCEQHKIDLKEVAGHKDRQNADTDCPGKDLYRYLEDGQLKKWIGQALAGKEVKIELGEPLKSGPVEKIPQK